MSSFFWLLWSYLAPIARDAIRKKLRERFRERFTGDQAQPGFLSNPRQSKFLMLAALSAVGMSASAANINGEAKRQQNNTQKLQQIHAPVRAKFAATIEDLEANDQKPYIVHAWRNPKSQAAIKAAGHSKVAWSFHNATTRAGLPDALAMDVVDNRYFWQTGNDFFLMEASAAQSHGLTTGIRWGLTNPDRRRIDALIAGKNWNAKYKRGWDPGHTQVTGLTLGQAKAGKRPKYK